MRKNSPKRIRIVPRKSNKSKRVVDAAPLNGRSDPAWRDPIRRSVDGYRRVTHNESVVQAVARVPKIDERQARKRPAARRVKIGALARRFVRKRVRQRAARRRDNIGRMQRQLPRLRAARRLLRVDKRKSFKARLKRLFGPRQTPMFKQNCNVSAAVARGVVDRAAAKVRPRIAERPVVLLLLNEILRAPVEPRLR